MHHLRTTLLTYRAFITVTILAVPVACATQADDFPDKPPPGVIEGCPSASPSEDPSGIRDKCGVFVSSSKGSDYSDGSQAKPVETLEKAIQLAKQTGRRVYACAESYAEGIAFSDLLEMYGYFDCTAAPWKVGSVRAKIVAPSSPAVSAVGVNAGRLDGFEIQAPDATVPSGSSIGVVARQSPGLRIVNCLIHAGKGAKGADGVEGEALKLANNGGKGADAVGTLRSCCKAGTTTEWDPIALETRKRRQPGGQGGCMGPTQRRDSPSGGSGGSGAPYHISEGDWEPSGSPTAGDPGSLDQARGGTPPFNEGIEVGHEGNPGQDGHSGGSMGAFNSDGTYAPADGALGTDGQYGQGGGGGGGLGTPDHGTVDQCTRACSGTGAGGGAGGCPGLAGRAGLGGGASIAVVALQSPLEIVSSQLESSAGGDGGKGTNGSLPSDGGAPGAGNGGHAGTAGGRGGRAGISGSGGGGPSIGIVSQGGTPRLTDTTIKHGAGGAGVPELANPDLRTVPASATGTAGDTQVL